jgi:hypothetical protein
MVKLPGLSRTVNPVYVLLSSVIGGTIPFTMYMGNFPASKQPYGLQFTSAPSFLTWVFLLSILFSGLTFLIIPAWKGCHKLYLYVIDNNRHRPWNVIGALMIATAMYLAVLLALFSLGDRGVKLPPCGLLNELNHRFIVVYVYTALGFLPVMFSIILINYITEIISADIPLINNDEGRSVEFIQEYLYYRNILEICLVTSGIILSLNPIISAAYISIWKEIGIFSNETIPSKVIIIYGLIITFMFVLIYVPTYFNLMNVGREFRDAKYPYPQQLGEFKGNMEKRKILDELLQTNVGITENLKNGIFTLSPLVSGLMASLLGF